MEMVKLDTLVIKRVTFNLNFQLQPDLHILSFSFFSYFQTLNSLEVNMLKSSV